LQKSAVPASEDSLDPALTLNGEYNWQPGDPLVIWKRGAQDCFCFEEGSGLSLGNIRVQAALHYALKLRGGGSALPWRIAMSPRRPER